MARKRLNKNLVIAISLFGFAAMIALSVVMLQRLQQRDPKYFVELAEQAKALENWQQAALFYDQAWRRSNEPHHLVELGEVLLRDGEIQKARAVWMQALVQSPELIDAHVRQLTLLLRNAKLYDAAQDWSAVHEAAQALLAVNAEKTPSEKAFAHNAYGLAMIQLRERGQSADEGRGHLQKARETDPQNVEHALDLAREYVRRGEADRVDAFFRELIAHFAEGGNAAKVRVAYAQYVWARDRGAAEQLYKEAIDLAAIDPAALREAKLAYANYLTQEWMRARREAPNAPETQALFDSARQIVEACIQDDPDAFDGYLQLVGLYRLAGRHTDVVNTCEQRIDRGFSRKGLEAAQNRVSAFTLMIYASEACVALSVEAGQRNDAAQREQWLARAEQYVVDARGEAPTHPRVLSQAGRVKIARGLERAGLEDVRAADEGYHAFGVVNWENRIIRARVHLQLNEAGAAKTVLEEVLDEAARQRPGDPIFWNLYAQALVQVGELDRGLAVVERVLLARADNIDAKRIKAAIFERQGKSLEAGKLEEEISGSGVIRAILEARAAAMDGSAEQALSILRAALVDNPSDSRLVSALAQELLGLNRADEAEQAVQQALARDAENEALQRLSLAVRRDLTPEGREQALMRMVEAEEDGFKRALQLVAIHSRKNDAAATLKAIDDALVELKAAKSSTAQRFTAAQHAALLRTKLRAASQVNDEAAMIDARDEAARLNVDGAGGKSILGLYHLARREYELAIQAFRAALDEQPTHVISSVMMGQSLQILGRNDEARAAYEQASKVNPNEPLAHQGLALLAQLKSDTEKFHRELEICERLMPDDPWVQEQVLIRGEGADPAGAIKRREQQLAELGEQPANLQRLAVLYETVKDQASADRTFQRLLELLPDDARTAMSAAAYFRRTGRPDRAIQAITHYAESRPTPEAQAAGGLLVASEHFQQGNLEATERTLLASAEKAVTREVAQTLADFYRQTRRPTKALPWLDRAVDLSSASGSTALAAVLEQRVACLLDRELNELQRAAADVAELKRRFPDNPRGFLLDSEVRARAGEIDEAVASLSDYLVKRPDDAYALFQRARHQIARGRPADAVADLERIKRSDSSSVEARILLARIREREGRKDLALAELESLVADVPNSVQAVRELLEAYLREKKFADADRIVTGLINRSGGGAEAQWLFLRGRISLELGEPDKALADFRKGAEVQQHSSSAVAAVLDAYLRLERFAAGAQYYEALGSREERDALVLARYARLLARSGASPRAIDAFRNAMTQAAADDNQAVSAVMENLSAAFALPEALDLFAKTPPPPTTTRANERIMVRLLAVAGRTDEAVARGNVLVQSAVSDPDRASLLQDIGDLHQVAGNMDQALDAYEQSLRYDAENWVTLNNVAYLLSDKRRENQRALVYAKQAVAKADNPYTLDTLGWIYAGLDDLDQAVAELSRAIRLNPDYTLSYYHLGEAYRRQGQYNQSVDVLESGKRLIQGSSEAVELAPLIDASLEKCRRRDNSS